MIEKGKSNRNGRPKLFSGKVDTRNIDKQIFKKEYNDDEIIIYGAIVYCVTLERKTKVAYGEFLTKTQDIAVTTMFSAQKLKRKQKK